jgi:hypothetical protein
VCLHLKKVKAPRSRQPGVDPPVLTVDEVEVIKVVPEPLQQHARGSGVNRDIVVNGAILDILGQQADEI